ncbi:MAG: hypothetical protein A2161_03335 [Candidatus Schekmanbacteria bacterium RBG_13_48_7]|uniref:Uncharacterized protein n=1 Tax=Candidatus Schekmanbacteria bacterium RBG_13_48_7 TaxID=1817878 RepID=A0A1F7RV38_9BACT|nr:MAG: hypothetical protein A2161_03335 [Candidatus Schekmanbacteria bacterium RBG_13_48_7]
MINIRFIFCIVLTGIILTGVFSCSSGDKVADKISKTMVEQPMDKAKRTKLQADLTTIPRAVQIFFADKGRYPKDLQELVDEGYLQTYPQEPFGGQYLYDPATGKVKSSTRPNFKPGDGN